MDVNLIRKLRTQEIPYIQVKKTEAKWFWVQKNKEQEVILSIKVYGYTSTLND